METIQKVAIAIALAIIIFGLVIASDLSALNQTTQRLYQQKTEGKITILAINNNLSHTWITLERTFIGLKENQTTNYTLPLRPENLPRIEEIGIN